MINSCIRMQIAWEGLLCLQEVLVECGLDHPMWAELTNPQSHWVFVSSLFMD
jgi:hypothetical protein